MKKMNKSKTRNGKNMKNEIEVKKMTIEEIGTEVKNRLDRHYSQWGAGLQFKTIMSSQAYRAKALGIGVGQLADLLEEKGFIKVFNTPNGARFIFSGDCPMTDEEMQNWLQEQEILKEAQKDMKKQLKAQA